MKRDEKQQFISWMKEETKAMPALVLAEYRGLNVAQMTELRRRCREAGVKFKVAKNTLLRLALQGTPLEAVVELLPGPTAMAWHPDDPGAAARVLAGFAREKENQALVIKGAAISGRRMGGEEVKTILANLPGRDDLLARLAGLMSAGPAMLHRVLAAGPATLGRALAALKHQRETEAGGS